MVEVDNKKLWAFLYLRQIGNVAPKPKSIQVYLNLMNPEHEDYDDKVEWLYKKWAKQICTDCLCELVVHVGAKNNTELYCSVHKKVCNDEVENV